jgi:hypothetical protein
MASVLDYGLQTRGPTSKAKRIIVWRPRRREELSDQAEKATTPPYINLARLVSSLPMTSSTSNSHSGLILILDFSLLPKRYNSRLGLCKGLDSPRQPLRFAHAESRSASRFFPAFAFRTPFFHLQLL